MGTMLSLFKGDLIRIREQLSSVDSKCNLKAVMMFVSMIQDRFTDDDFLTGKFVIMFYIIDSLFFPCLSLVFWLYVAYDALIILDIVKCAS